MNDLEGHRTARKRIKTSRQRAQSAAEAYFELCLLQRERDRLEREAIRLTTRGKEIEKRLREIAKEMDVLQNMAERKPVGTGKEDEGGLVALPLSY